MPSEVSHNHFGMKILSIQVVEKPNYQINLSEFACSFLSVFRVVHIIVMCDCRTIAFTVLVLSVLNLTE